MLQELIDLAELGTVGGVIVVTVTRSSIFKPLREMADAKFPWLGDLVHCPYCFGHWTGMLLTLLFGVNIVGSGNWLLDTFASALCLTWLSVVAASVVFRSASTILIPDDEK
jgi:hypothetical protein